MKKEIAALLFAGVILCGLTACTNADTENMADSFTAESNSSQTKSGETVSVEPIQETANGKLKIKMNFVRGGTQASNQYAVWIENKAGELIKTLYVTDFTADGGYAQREDSLPVWVSKAKPENMEKAEIDAVSGATPQSGIQEFEWDGTDKDGVPVSDGTYQVYVEGTLYWSSSVLYSGSFDLGGQSGNVEMIAAYTESDEEQNKDMLTEVTVEYIAGENEMNYTRNDLGALSSKDALEYMKATPDLVIVDVATTRWYNEEHFENAIHIPIEELNSEEEDALYMEIPSGVPVLLHCRRGMVVPGAYERVKELRPDIPEISYIDGVPPFAEYNEWLADQKSAGQEQRLLGGQTPEDALEYMKNTPNLVIVEVNAEEWKLSNGINGAMWIPYTEMADRYDEIPKDRPVLLHCGGGIVSVEAYEILQEKRPDIPELSYIAGAPPVSAYNEWLEQQN